MTSLLLAVALTSTQQSGPWNNDLMLRTSKRGKAFGEETTFVGAAGVPSIVKWKGKLVAAFQWFPFNNQDAWDQVALKTSDDGGKTWSGPSPVKVQGLPEGYQRPFDPTLSVCEDGKLRLYFTSNTRGARALDDTTGIYSAVSADGKAFRFEPGARFAVSGRRVVDCAVLRLGKTWHMVAPIGRPEDGAYHATSTDGLDFTRLKDIPSVGRANWTGNLVAAGPGMCFYGCGEGGLWWSYSKDGDAWSDPTYLNIGGGDPAIVNVDADTVMLIYVGRPRSTG